MMGAINRIGTQIRLPDGREATTVFNGLSGVGIKWGLHNPPLSDFEGTSGDCFAPAEDSPARRPGWPWKMGAMLRDPEMADSLGIECVGEDYEILREAKQ